MTETEALPSASCAPTPVQLTQNIFHCLVPIKCPPKAKMPFPLRKPSHILVYILLTCREIGCLRRFATWTFKAMWHLSASRLAGMAMAMQQSFTVYPFDPPGDVAALRAEIRAFLAQHEAKLGVPNCWVVGDPEFSRALGAAGFWE
jgi:hypothetical protein